MKGTTHMNFGAMAGLVAAVATSSTHESAMVYGGTLIAGSVIGALVPDIDAEHSLITQKAGLVGDVVAKGLSHRGITHTLLGAFIFFLGTMGISTILTENLAGTMWGNVLIVGLMLFVFEMFYKHVDFLDKILSHKTGLKRKTCHKVVLLIVALGIMAMYNDLSDHLNTLSLGLTLGYLSHIVSDCFNVSGCAIAYPFSSKYISVGRFRTGEDDGIFIVASTIVLIVLLVLI